MLALVLLLSCASKPSLPAEADLVVVGTLYAEPGAPPREAAVLVRDGVVAAVVDRDELLEVGGTNARVLVADRVTPGFVDAHAHPDGLGRMLVELDLNGAASYAEALERVAAAPPGDWLLGRGWDQNDWADAPAGGWPLAADLERLWPGRPVALRRVDGHAVWVSPAALRRGEITATTADPAGGRIVRDAAGAPSGVLIDEAMALVEAPEPDPAERERHLRAALDAIAAVGLTGVHAMSVSDDALAIYERLDEARELHLRLWCYVDPDSKAAARLLAKGPWGRGNVHVVGIKTFADGALGSRGALLREDYADEPGHRGLQLATRDELAALAGRALAVDAQLAVHAIGDGAVNAVLDAYASARADHPEKGQVRLRVEHAQVVAPRDVGRFASLGVVASMQPTHATSDMPWAPARLGPERIRHAYAWRTLKAAGAPIAFGSDFPVERPEPALGLWAATTRTDPGGKPVGGWLPDEALAIDDAIAAFTAGSAWAVGEEGRLGRVVPGLPADLTLWSVGPDGRWRATATIVGGRVAWAESR